MLDLLWVIVDNPQSVVDGCCYVLKFWLDRIYSFGDNAIFRFSHFGLKLPIHATFRGVLQTNFPEMTSPIILSPKGTSLHGNTSFEP